MARELSERMANLVLKRDSSVDSVPSVVYEDSWHMTYKNVTEMLAEVMYWCKREILNDQNNTKYMYTVDVTIRKEKIEET